MSTLRVDNIAKRSGTAQDTMQGQAKVFGNLNGTGTIAYRSSFNISSATDGGVGQFTHNFTASMANGNYAWTTACTRTNDTGSGRVVTHWQSAVSQNAAGSILMSNLYVSTLAGGGTADDTDVHNVIVHGVLA